MWSVTSDLRVRHSCIIAALQASAVSSLLRARALRPPSRMRSGFEGTRMTEIFPAIVYVLCFLTSAACAWLLGRSYRRNGTRLLLWSSVCFSFLALNNLALVLDLVV